MQGLVKGRIVYLVLSQDMADQINRRRTTGASIIERLDGGLTTDRWPAGAQAHIGEPVYAGDTLPAMVVAVRGEACNLKANLDGSDQYWVQHVPFDNEKRPGSWHWMFDGQSTRYDPTAKARVIATAEGQMFDARLSPDPGVQAFASGPATDVQAFASEPAASQEK
jgi:hypothetical protein